jgi:hypothetical protein
VVPTEPGYSLSIERGQIVPAKAAFCARERCDETFVSTDRDVEADLRDMGWVQHPRLGWLCHKHAIAALPKPGAV